MYGYDFILQDSELKSIANEFKTYGSELEDTLDQYDEIINTVITGAIPSGAVHDALVLYQEYVVKLKEITSQTGQKFARVVNDFIGAVESADDYLYDAGISSVARDFSDAEYNRLMKCLDDPWCSITDSIGDWIYGKILKVVSFFHWDGIKAKLQNCHTLLLDYNDETAQGLKQMFERVYGVDIDYVNHFNSVVTVMNGTRDLMNEMADLINPASGSFTVANINMRLGHLFSDLQSNFEKMINIPERGVKPPDFQITNFVSQPWAQIFFDSFLSATVMFISDIGFWDGAQMVTFKMFGIAKDTIIHREYYEDYMLKKQLLSVLEDLAKGNNFSGTTKEELDDLKTFLKYYRKYGDKVYEYLNTHRIEEGGKLILDGRTVEARHFREMLKSFKNTGKILSYGTEGIDYLARLLADYELGLNMLDSFERNYSRNPQMLACVEDIKALYNKEFLAWADEAIDRVSKIGLDAAMQALADKTPVFAVVSAIEKTIDVVGDVSGLGGEAESKFNALIYYQLQTSSNQAYKSAVEKLRLAAPESEEYSLLADDVYNCFELNKKNLVAMFKAMANASTGEMKSYYRYCAGKAEDLTMNDGAKPDILSYEEFLSMGIY